jgi:methionine-rich copper-binding protein CopC
MKSSFLVIRKNGKKSILSITIFFLMCFGLMLLIQCSSDKNSADLAPPLIVSQSPSAESDNIPINAQLVIVFNKSIGGVSTSSITLTRVNSFGAVESDITYDETSKTVTLKPKNNLEYNTLYVAVVNSSIHSLSGVPFSADSWVFSTGTASDIVKPAVTTVLPSPNADFIDINSEISAVFSEKVSKVTGDTVSLSGTISAGSYLLKNLDTGEYVPSIIAYNDVKYKAVLKPGVQKTGSITIASNIITNISDTSGIRVGDIVSGTGIIVGTKVSKINSTDVELSMPCYEAKTGIAIDFLRATPLEDWTNYQIELTSGITDIAGNTLESSANTGYVFMTNDQNKPTILDVTPLGGSSNVVRSTSIYADFSEKLKASTVIAANVYLLDETGENISSVLTYDATKKQIILDPSVTLDAGKTFTVHITDGITDRAGNTFAGVTWSFTTGSDVADTTAPTVLSITPASGSLSINPQTVVTVQFSEDVVGVSDSSFLIKVADATGYTNTTVVYSSATRTAVLTPVLPLSEGIAYTVSLSSSITDSSGHTLNFTPITFTTQDNTKPTVTTKTPDSGDVVSTNSIQVVFSESVGSTVSSSTFTVATASSGVPVSGMVSCPDSLYKTWIFTPDSGTFSASTTYQVTLSSGIKDSAGNTLNLVQWNFTTAAAPDTTAPTISSSSPANGETDVALGRTISFTFSETVVSTSIGKNNVKLMQGGSEVDSSVSYDASNRTVNILPSKNLTYGQTYTVKVFGSSVSGYTISDLSAHLLADTTFSFTAKADNDAPYVLSKIPVSGTIGMEGNAIDIEAVFSEPVSGVDADSFKLRYSGSDSNGNETMSSLMTIDNRSSTNYYCYRMRLTNTTSCITKDGTYSVYLDTTKIKDTAGNMLSDPGIWTVGIAGKDSKTPYVTIKSPLSEATPWREDAASGYYVVKAQFSENVQTVDQSSFTVKKDGGSELTAYAVAYNPESFTATLLFDPTDISYYTSYTVTLKGTITDIAGNGLSQDASGTLKGDQTWKIKTDQDFEAPTILSKSPTGDGITYSSGSKVTVNFSETIKASSVTLSTFFVKKSSAADSEKLTTVSDPTLLIPPANYALTFTSALEGDTEYQVVLTNGITDDSVNENKLSETRWIFKTAVKPDTTAPTVLSTYPAESPIATGISQTPTLTVAFSENVTNANTSRIRLLDSSSAVVPTTLSYNSTTFVATITPSSQLTGGGTYTLSIDANIQDPTGNALGTAKNISFTAAGDTTGPTCTIGYRAPSGTNISTVTSGNTLNILNPEFIISFNEAITASTVTSSNITLKQGSTTIQTYLTFDDTVNKVYVNLYSDGTNVKNGLLKGSTSYTMTVTSGITDIKGNANTSTTPVTFTTPSSLPVITNISFGSTTVANNATGVAVDSPSISVTFDRAMNSDKIWFELYSADTVAGHAVTVSPGAMSWSADTKTISIPLVGQMKASTAYKMRFYGWAGTFEDSFGNILDRATYVSGGVLSFTTGTDTTSPVISNSIPANSSTAVGTALPVIVVTFSEPMNTSVGSATLNHSATLAGPIWSDGGKTVLFTPSGLAVSTTYTLMLSGFTDINGNALSGATRSFTTSTVTDSDPKAVLGLNSESTTLVNYSNSTTNSTYTLDSALTTCSWTPLTTDSSVKTCTYGFLGDTAKATWFRAPSGLFMYLAASADWDYNDNADIESIASADFLAAGTYLLSFQMAHNGDFNQSNRVQIQVSTDGGTNYTAVQKVAGKYDSIYRFEPNSRTTTLNGTFSSGGTVITGLSSTAGLKIGDHIRTSAYFPNSSISGGYTMITSINSGSSVTVSNSAITAGSNISLSFEKVWTTHYVDLSQYADNSSVKVKIRAYSAGETGTNVYIDNVSVVRY